jgi:flagellar L-ring protein precursor FlgH
MNHASNNTFDFHRLFRTVAALALLTMAANRAAAQNSSLFFEDLPTNAHPLTLKNSSWLYQETDPVKPLRLNDLVTVVVNEKSQVTSDATIQRRKQAQLNAELSNWVKMQGLALKPDHMNDGDLHINGTLQGQFRSQSDLDTRDAMSFRIAARIVDIRPNGHLVLEAHRTIRNNSEQWDQSLTGIVRPEDILPNNTVLSEDVAELSIFKREQGLVRDGYRRGWLYKLIDRYGLF